MRCLYLSVSLVISTALGCSSGDAPTTAGASNDGTTKAETSANHPAAIASSQFLNAIARGDQTTAMKRLTPLAAEQLKKNGKGFAFSAVEQANFVVTRVEQPDPAMAAVEFHMEASAEGETVEFDVCCFMQEIGGDWRLGGIAYDLGNGEEPVVVNYEAAPTSPPVNPGQNNTNQVRTASEFPTEGTHPAAGSVSGGSELR